MASINWNQYIKAAEEAGESLDDFTPLPDGSYEAKCLEAKAVKTNDGKKDMIKVTWVVEGGPHAGRRLWSNMVVSPESPKAMAILIRQLSALGMRPLLDQGASFEQIAAGLKGALSTLKVSVGEWKGKPKNDVDAIAGRQGGFSGPSGVAVPAAPSGLPV